MKSRSPFAETFSYSIDQEKELVRINKFCSTKRKTVVVQGLGFVGSAMLAALAIARDDNGEPLYNVLGVDLADEDNYWKIGRVEEGLAPVKSTDVKLEAAFQLGIKAGNLMATYAPYAYEIADIIVVDIHLDINKTNLGDTSSYKFSFGIYEKALTQVAQVCREDVLIIIETTVPPGTTEKVVHPLFEKIFAARDLDINKLKLAHSYERVMPGPGYLDSITNFFRVFSAIGEEAKQATRKFLESFINTGDFPLSEMTRPTASEMAKVLENSYRAMNIAFISEWGRYAEDAGVNLYEVIDAIRVRPTHKNIMWPGFGVGGYCLTKDSLLADWSMKNLYGNSEGLKNTLKAIEINDMMPRDTVRLIKSKVGSLSGRTITLMGISYLNDVADTRYSPAYLFTQICKKEGAEMIFHDPVVDLWEEMKLQPITELSELALKSHDIVVFTVRHKEYLELSAEQMCQYFPNARVFVDAFNIIDAVKAEKLQAFEKIVVGIGKGNLCKN
jgi:UDP-N-acetyl-D-glucosamine dehydrogenase